MPRKRTDGNPTLHTTPVLKGGKGLQAEPRHDLNDLDEFVDNAIGQELHSVRAGQGPAPHATRATKSHRTQELRINLYRPFVQALRDRCNDLALSDAIAFHEVNLRRALHRTDNDDRALPASLWDNAELLRVCALRGMWTAGVGPATLSCQLLEYELGVAQDRPPQDRWNKLDWRLMRLKDPALLAPPLSPDTEATPTRLSISVGVCLIGLLQAICENLPPHSPSTT
ncbi:hypothetical protein B0J12DRAFT_37187 [Macrophomina phaseolina]|uniref:Uncharacterized protein n=1 Tax=Macrophomina phaseolina TaxID=35725 RepID=A0ABQ8GW57_9PEZI|nr:hypothetical protein B0J12DRAFT_37187 [Macrophomina phaseolina]